MFFYDFGLIMYWAFWAALGAVVLGFWMVLFSNAITWAVNFANDNQGREYRFWYERMIMETWGDCEWNEDHQRYTTDNYKTYFGPTDESSKADAGFRGDKRFAYWIGSGWVWAIIYFPMTLLLGVAVYFWFLAIPIFATWLIALYMRGVIRRKKAKAALAVEQPVAEEAA